MGRKGAFLPYLQAAPLAAVFGLFFIVPLLLTLVVSFWDYNAYEIIPDFVFVNYQEIFEGCLADLPELCLTFKTYLSTLKFCFLVWLLTLLIGFTLSYDELARSTQAAGDLNTLPLELQGLTTTVTTPEIYALGTLTTAVSFAVIFISLAVVLILQRRRARHGSDAGAGMV